MAWTFIGGNISTSSKAASSTITIAYSVPMSVGDVAVAFAVTDNIATGDGDQGDIVSIADSVGNTYSKALQTTNGQGAAAGGVTVALYYCKLTSAVTTSDTCTITFNGSPVAKAFSVFQFTIGSGNSVTVAGSYSEVQDNATAVTPSISGLTSGE